MTWNRMAFAKGDPVGFGDENGTQPCDSSGDPSVLDPCPALADGGDGGYGLNVGQCILDEMPVSCSMIRSDAVIALPPGVVTATLPWGWQQAVSALTTPSCAALFGMGSISPVTLLSEVNIVYEALTDHDIYGETYFPGMVGNPSAGQYTIVINTTNPQYTANGGAEDANTLIHELLHVAVNMGYAAPQGWIQDDGNPANGGEPGNNNLITTACGLGPIW